MCQNQHCGFTYLSNINPFPFLPFTFNTENGPVNMLILEKNNTMHIREYCCIFVTHGLILTLPLFHFGNYVD